MTQKLERKATIDKVDCAYTVVTAHDVSFILNSVEPGRNPFGPKIGELVLEFSLVEDTLWEIAKRKMTEFPGINSKITSTSTQKTIRNFLSDSGFSAMIYDGQWDEAAVEKLFLSRNRIIHDSSRIQEIDGEISVYQKRPIMGKNQKQDYHLIETEISDLILSINLYRKFLFNKIR